MQNSRCRSTIYVIQTHPEHVKGFVYLSIMQIGNLGCELETFFFFSPHYDKKDSPANRRDELKKNYSIISSRSRFSALPARKKKWSE